MTNDQPDAATPLSGTRLKHVAEPEFMTRFHWTALPTLTHLLALLLHSADDFPPAGTQLLVIDDLDTLVDLDYPRQTAIASFAKSDAQRWRAGRRHATLGCIVSALNKLAAFNDIAVLVTTGCATRRRSDMGLGAVLLPGVGGAEWDAAVYARLAVFRDFNGRFAGLQKLRGTNHTGDGGLGKIARFAVSAEGLPEDFQTEPLQSSLPVSKAGVSPVKPRKRTYDEIADSDAEDNDEYGWADVDEEQILHTERMLTQDRT